MGLLEQESVAETIGPTARLAEEWLNTQLGVGEPDTVYPRASEMAGPRLGPSGKPLLSDAMELGTVPEVGRNINSEATVASPLRRIESPGIDIYGPGDITKEQASTAVRGAKQLGWDIGKAAKFRVTGPTHGADLIPIMGGVIGMAEHARILEAANRLSWKNPATGEGYDYTKPIRPEQMMPGALGSIPARYRTRAQDEKGMAEIFVRVEKQAKLDSTFSGKLAQGLIQLPVWMTEFALTGGLESMGNQAAKKVGQRILKQYVTSRTGSRAVRLAGWTAGAVTRASVGLSPRVAEKTFERQVNVQVLDDEQEGWATSFAKAWGDTVIEAASEEAGQTLTKIPVKAVNLTRFGRKMTSALQRAWMKATGGTAGQFGRRMAQRGGYSNIIGEIGEERLGTALRAITKVDNFGLGKESTRMDRLKAGLIQDAQNIGVEVIVLSVPMAGQVALGTMRNPPLGPSGKPLLSDAMELGTVPVGPEGQPVETAEKMLGEFGIEPTQEEISAVSEAKPPQRTVEQPVTLEKAKPPTPVEPRKAPTPEAEPPTPPVKAVT
ncbi:MAG: hypothetical protein ACYTAF_16435, partial [Planctomycetota bacterium]